MAGGTVGRYILDGTGNPVPVEGDPTPPPVGQGNRVVTMLSDQLELSSRFMHTVEGNGVVSITYAVRVRNLETKEEWLVTRGRFYACKDPEADVRLAMRVADIGVDVERVSRSPFFDWPVPADPSMGPPPEGHMVVPTTATSHFDQGDFT